MQVQPLRNNFTHQRFIVTVPICNKLVCFITAKLFVSVSNIFEATRFAIFDISKLDVMFQAKCYVQFLKKFLHAHIDSVFDRHYDCIARQSTREYACIVVYVKRLETRRSIVALVFYVNVIINIQTENYRGLIFKSCHMLKRLDICTLIFTRILSTFQLRKVRISQQCKRKKVGGVRPCFAMSRKTNSNIDKSLDFISL